MLLGGTKPILTGAYWLIWQNEPIDSGQIEPITLALWCNCLNQNVFGVLPQLFATSEGTCYGSEPGGRRRENGVDDMGSMGAGWT